MTWLKGLFSLSNLKTLGLTILGILTAAIAIFGYGRKTAADSIGRKTAEEERDAAKKARQTDHDVKHLGRKQLDDELRKFDRKH